MASMQIVGGAAAATPGKSGSGGGIDPVMMGISPEAAAAAGMSGDGSLQEHPFASELAAALATLDAQQAQALAENLLDGALQDGQILDPAAMAQAIGQNLPVDPAFQNAILASFAALSGAVQADMSVKSGGDGHQGAAAQAQAIETGLLLSAAETGITDGLATAVADVAVTAPANETGAIGPTATATSGPSSMKLKTDQSGVSSTATLGLAADVIDSTTSMNSSATTTPTAAAAVSDESISSGATSQNLLQGKSLNTGSAESPNHGSLAAAGAREVNSSAAAGQGATSQGQSQSGASPQDQAAIAASIAEAARGRMEKEASEYAAKQTSLAGTAVNDVGNIVVTAKPNAEGVAAASDAARQSAQRTEVASAASTQASAQSAEAARAESRLEAARASLGSGPLNVEVLKLTRQGGGRAVLEVTPPNQGPIRIDLQLDGAGRASLVVEGLTDSMKARLESSAHFLRQDMAQMGLALNLEMRERNDSGGAAQAFAQSQFGQSGQGGGRDQGSMRANAQATSSVAGNNSVAQRSAAVDDGIHLVA
ncbi:MAG: flagellar hook-length control protein FliK [Betaproteobacteria bacterium]|nr:flagellar hook-length control protein FliK [Betaproteobacteria bacterium]